ncbi:hypothetical protein I7X12_16620 [Halosimplex litoreum]|uniref:Lipoprotein n=1 Tax=Halosimplex litoreum TaxID=1198301 RepID=A0A7T3FX52_9EURY|nr:hypothetical protein [Halosimplex litoreum]QPV62345.1 hypothetical protein I7X12_16620 [Halosimplex litoreum]
MRHRTALALALVALVAGLSGCSAEGSLSLTPVDDRALAQEASHVLPTDGSPDEDERVVRRAIDNGTATAVGERPPVDEQLPFRHDGRFYAVEYAENGTEPGYEFGIRIDFNASTVDGRVVDYQKLPAVDRDALAFVLSRDLPDEGALEPGFDFGVGGTYTEDDAESSVLVPAQEYDAVRYEGEVYPIDVEAERTELTVYRYEASEVAGSHETYADSLRERYEFELSGLSQGERDLVNDSLNETYWVEDSDNRAFDALVDRFRAQNPVEETDYGGSYVVRYDGGLYWAEIDYGGYATDE